MSLHRFAAALPLLFALAATGPAHAGPPRPARWVQGPTSLAAPLVDTDFLHDGAPPTPLFELGRRLFFDKVLSGNRNVSCATCHHALTDSGDGLSLPVGEGGRGLGTTRDLGRGDDAVHERVPRNSPALFNLGARAFTRLFWDGRLEADASEPSGFRSPAGADLPPGLDSALAAQAMFPVTSPAEMAGQAGENPVADAAALGDLAGPDGVWEQLAARLRSLPGYVERFVAAFDDVDGPEDIEFVHAANAIAAFEAAAFRADDSPFDRFLRGDRGALSPAALRGLHLFHGAAGCGSCHAGVLQTDLQFHAIAMPQVGPGKGDGGDGHDDHGRERVTGRRADRFRFRTPSLRNVAATGPWGHAGAHDDLEATIRHHLDPRAALESYDPGQLVLPHRPDLDALDLVAHRDPARRAALAGRSEIEPVALSDREVDALVAFLEALTDRRSLDARTLVPAAVPSGLPLAE